MKTKKIKTLNAKDILSGFSDKVYMISSVGNISEKKVLEVLEINKSIVMHIENVGVRVFARHDISIKIPGFNDTCIFTDLNKAVEEKTRRLLKIKENAAATIKQASKIIKMVDTLEKEIQNVSSVEHEMIEFYNQKLSSWSNFQRTIRAESESLDSNFRNIYNSSSC